MGSGSTNCVRAGVAPQASFDKNAAIPDPASATPVAAPAPSWRNSLLDSLVLVIVCPSFPRSASTLL